MMTLNITQCPDIVFLLTNVPVIRLKKDRPINNVNKSAG